MSNPFPCIVNWCPGGACDPCAIGIGLRLDADGNAWSYCHGHFYDIFRSLATAIPFVISYNGSTIWTLDPRINPIAYLTGPTPIGALQFFDGAWHQEYVFTGNIPLGNFSDPPPGTVIPSPSPIVRNGIDLNQITPVPILVDGVIAAINEVPTQTIGVLNYHDFPVFIDPPILCPGS